MVSQDYIVTLPLSSLHLETGYLSRDSKSIKKDGYIPSVLIFLPVVGVLESILVGVVRSLLFFFFVK